MRRLRSRLALRIYLAGLAQVGAVILGFGLLIEGTRAYDRSRARDAADAVRDVAAKLGDSEAAARELSRVERAFDATITFYDEDGNVVLKSPSTDPQESDAAPDAEPPPHVFFGPPRSPGRLRPPPGSSGELYWPGPPRPPHGPSFLRHEHGPLPPPPHRPPPGRGFGFDPFRPPPGPPVMAFVIPVELPGGGAGGAMFSSRKPRPLPANTASIAGIVLFVVGVASWITARSLVRPLTRLASAARAFGEGKLDARVGLARSDEIGEVASAFDEMAGRVESSLRAEKELLANISHELRTPLARIHVALDLAAEGDAATAREALTEITTDLGELEQLISDVLTAARLDLGRGGAATGIPPLRHEHVDVEELVGRAAARFRVARPERELDVEIAPDLPSLTGDAVLLRRAVDNLLENAHKYTSRPEDSVALRAARAEGEVWIEVSDQGVGIAAEDLPRIFEPFFRADRSRTRATGGLGLGLTLARRIVEAHHGTIEVESRVGEGTRMRVRLPTAPAPPR